MTDCLSVIHGPVKTHALVEIAAYELGKGDKCVERVEALFDHLVFIFPGSWTIDTKMKKEVGNCMIHSAIANVIFTTAMEVQSRQTVPYFSDCGCNQIEFFQQPASHRISNDQEMCLNFGWSR